MPHVPMLMSCLFLSALSAFAATGPLAPELRSLWTTEATYHQERGYFSTDFQAIEFAPPKSVGMRIDSLAPTFLVGLAWRDGMLRALRIDTLGTGIGPLGWEDTAGTSSALHVLSRDLFATPLDTTFSRRTFHLWKHQVGDTTWNLALDTNSMEILGIRRVPGHLDTLGLDTLPREIFIANRALKDARAEVMEVTAWQQEKNAYPDVPPPLDSARAVLPLVRLWQTNSGHDSALVLVLDPLDASLGAWSSSTGLRGRSSLDRSVYAPAIRTHFAEILTRKVLPPGQGNGWLSETDTLHSGDSSLVLELRIFRHGDTTLVTALERDGISAFCRLQIPAGFLDFGFAPASSVISASKRTTRVRIPLRTDILGRPREGARLGTTPLRIRH